jgi:hypothetical protein
VDDRGFLLRLSRQRKIVRFYSMLPPKWFEDPPNELDLYLIEDASSRTLAPLVEEPAPSMLVDQ